MTPADARLLAPPVIPPHPSTPQGGWLAGFPHRSFLELGAYRNAAGSARGHARSVLGEWRLGHLADAVLQVLSELVANAVTATERVAWDGGLPPVRLWLLGGPGPGAAGAGEVLVLVWDAVASEPAPRQASDLDESAGWRSWTASAAGSGTGACRARRTAGRSPGHSSTARGAISRPARPARPGPRRASSSSPALPAAPPQLSLPAKTTENKEEVTE